jgi:hypothetical protein
MLDPFVLVIIFFIAKRKIVPVHIRAIICSANLVADPVRTIFIEFAAEFFKPTPTGYC